MVAYTTALGDLEMGVEEKTVVLVEKKSPTGWIWNVFGALLVVALCLGGILFFAWYWNGRPEMMVRSVSVFMKLTRNLCQNYFQQKKKNISVISNHPAFPSIQRESGQTEALTEKDTAEKTGNFKASMLI